MESMDLVGKFVRLGELLHRRRHRRQRGHGPMADPHRGQGRVMALLKMHPEISQKELSYLLDIRPQSLGELLAKLERNGFIERSPSESDRRGMEIRLTGEGMRAADARLEEPDNLFASLNDDEMETLGSYLDRIIGDLENATGLDDEECGRGCHGGGPRHHDGHRHGMMPHSRHDCENDPPHPPHHGPHHGPERGRHGHGMCGRHGEGHGRRDCGCRHDDDEE